MRLVLLTIGLQWRVNPVQIDRVNHYFAIVGPRNRNLSGIDGGWQGVDGCAGITDFMPRLAKRAWWRCSRTLPTCRRQRCAAAYRACRGRRRDLRHGVNRSLARDMQMFFRIRC